MAPKKRRSAEDVRRAQERWEETVSRYCKGDSEKRADVEEICNRFPSLQMCVDHARGLIAIATDVEKKAMFPGGRAIPAVSVFLWAMHEAEKSPDPRQRARWYDYRSRRRPPPPPVEGLVGIVVATPAEVKQVIVHSDSDGGYSEDEEEDNEGEDDSSGEDDSEGEQVVVDVEDDSEGEQVVVDVAPADDNVYMVALGIPQLGDRSMPIEAETYIRVGIRHSDRIKKMKETQK